LLGCLRHERVACEDRAKGREPRLFALVYFLLAFQFDTWHLAKRGRVIEEGSSLSFIGLSRMPRMRLLLNGQKKIDEGKWFTVFYSSLIDYARSSQRGEGENEDLCLEMPWSNLTSYQV
jgi:hypothetical protein